MTTLATAVEEPKADRRFQDEKRETKLENHSPDDGPPREQPAIGRNRPGVTAMKAIMPRALINRRGIRKTFPVHKSTSCAREYWNQPD